MGEYTFHLSELDEITLRNILKEDDALAYKVSCAHILLKSKAGVSVAVIAEELQMTKIGVARIRRLYLKGGLYALFIEGPWTESPAKKNIFAPLDPDMYKDGTDIDRQLRIAEAFQDSPHIIKKIQEYLRRERQQKRNDDES